MLGYALRRLLLALPLLLGITFVSFTVIHLAPGEPAEIQTGDLSIKSDAQARQLLREMYDLDKPLHVQYGKWLARLGRLDFGKSFSPDGRPVLQKIGERLPVTLLLNIIEMLIIVALAVPIGVLSATRQYSLFDKVTTVFVFVGFATPDFWLALLLMILFGVQLGWLPISGLRSLNWEYLSFWRQQLDFVSHLLLPILVATFGGLAGFSRYMRQSMLEVVRQDYIQSARAKGLAEAIVIGKHALRNALLPIVTILGLSLPGLIGGSVIVESIFAIPGMGQLMVQAVFEGDHPGIMGNLVIVSTATLVANLVPDATDRVADRGRAGLARGLQWRPGGRGDHAPRGPDARLSSLLPPPRGARLPPALDLDDHGSDRPHGMDGRGAARPRGVPGAQGARVRHLVAGGRRERLSDRLAPHPAERDGARARGDDARHSGRDPHRIGPVVPRARRPAAARDVGQHPQRGQRRDRDRLGVFPVPRARAPRHPALVQALWRGDPRRARPPPAAERREVCQPRAVAAYSGFALRRSGGTGRRARLRGVWGNPRGFESPLRHQLDFSR